MSPRLPSAASSRAGRLQRRRGCEVGVGARQGLGADLRGSLTSSSTSSRISSKPSRIMRASRLARMRFAQGWDAGHSRYPRGPSPRASDTPSLFGCVTVRQRCWLQSRSLRPPQQQRGPGAEHDEVKGGGLRQLTPDGRSWAHRQDPGPIATARKRVGILLSASRRRPRAHAAVSSWAVTSLLTRGHTRSPPLRRSTGSAQRRSTRVSGCRPGRPITGR